MNDDSVADILRLDCGWGSWKLFWLKFCDQSNDRIELQIQTEFGRPDPTGLHITILLQLREEAH
jgi:hypothetical protein